jgi:YVTN family beta-propeller protein
VIDRRLVLNAALITAVVAGCASPGSSRGTATPSIMPSVIASPAEATAEVEGSGSPSASALPPAVDIEAAGGLAIDATTNVDWVVLVDGRAWMAGMAEGIGVFGESGEQERSIAVDGWCQAMDTGFGAVWSASCRPAGIIRIDAETAVLERVQFDDPINDSEASVGAGEGGVWVVAGPRSDVLLQVDPETLDIVHRYPIPAAGAGVRAGLGGVWVTRPPVDELLHVDPITGEIIATIPVGPSPRFLAVGEGSVWVMNQGDGSVSRVDPETDEVTATIDVGSEIHGGDIAVGGGSVWVRGGPELLARIDPANNRVTERYGPNAGSGSVAADDEAVWVTAHDVATVWRLPLE